MRVIIPEKIYIYELNQYVTNISGATTYLDGTAVQQLEPTFLNENGTIKPDRSIRIIATLQLYKLKTCHYKDSPKSLQNPCVSFT